MLASSTDVDEEDGSWKLRQVVWITHAGTLIKCSSERARPTIGEHGTSTEFPWTHEGFDGWLRKGQYEDLSLDAPPDEDKTDDELEGLEDDSSAA